MKWDEYFDKFYDWSESTQIKKLSSVEALGPADEVTEVMVEFAFNREDIVNRIARKAIEQKLVFSAKNIADLADSIDTDLLKQLAMQSYESFAPTDLENLIGMIDDDLVVKIYKAKGFKIPEEFSYLDDSEEYDDEPVLNGSSDGEASSGFFSRIAMAFGIAVGIRQGINDTSGSKPKKFCIGDHVRVKYRGQEGAVVDINADLYMVSLKDGGYVDSFSESELERAW